MQVDRRSTRLQLLGQRLAVQVLGIELRLEYVNGQIGLPGQSCETSLPRLSPCKFLDEIRVVEQHPDERRLAGVLDLPQARGLHRERGTAAFSAEKYPLPAPLDGMVDEFFHMRRLERRIGIASGCRHVRFVQVDQPVVDARLLDGSRKRRIALADAVLRGHPDQQVAAPAANRCTCSSKPDVSLMLSAGPARTLPPAVDARADSTRQTW